MHPPAAPETPTNATSARSSSVAPPDRMTLAYQALIGAFLAVLLSFGYWHLVSRLPAAVDLWLLVIVLFGGTGGVLYAVREGDLVAPRFSRQRGPATDAGPAHAEYVIQLGWAGDALFGIAGAAAIFLLIPGLSESAVPMLQDLIRAGRAEAGKVTPEEEDVRRKAATLVVQARALEVEAARLRLAGPSPAADVKDAEARHLLAQATAAAPAADVLAATDAGGGNKSGTDLLELIAIALIGGYGGRAVLQRASGQLLQRVDQKVEQVRVEAQQTAARVTHEVEQGRANSEALELVARRLNPDLPSPSAAEVEQAIARCTEAGRHRVFDFVLERLHTGRAGVAEGVVAVLTALLRWVSPTDRHAYLAALGEAHGRLKDYDAAVAHLDEAVELVKDDPAAFEQLKRYQSLREKLTPGRRTRHPAEPPPKG